MNRGTGPWVGGITGEGIFWSLAVVCTTVLAIAVLASGLDGCNLTSTVTCKDGASLTAEAVLNDPDLSQDDAEDFCQERGGVKEFVK